MAQIEITSSKIGGGGGVTPPSYIIRKSGSKILAVNGTTGNNDFSGNNASTIITSAINNLTLGRTAPERIHIKGQFTIPSKITIPSYTTLTLDGSLASSPNLNNDMLLIKDTYQVTLQGGTLDGQGSLQTSGSIINIDNSHVTTISNMYIVNAKDNNIRLTNNGSEFHLNNLTIDNPIGQEPVCGIRIENNLGGLFATDIDVLHCQYGVAIIPTIRAEWLFFENCAFDTCTINGILVTDAAGAGSIVRGVTFNGCWVGSSGQDGIGMAGSGVQGIRFIGTKSLGNTFSGFSFTNSLNCSMENCDVISNDPGNVGYNGIVVAGTSHNTSIIGCRIGNTWSVSGFQRYGIVVTATPNNLKVIGNNLSDNVTAGFGVLGSVGTNWIIHSNIGYNPQAMSAITPTGTGYIYTNNDGFIEQIILVAGATNTTYTINRPSGNTSSLTAIGGATPIPAMFSLYPGDGFTVTYTNAPTITKIPM